MRAMRHRSQRAIGTLQENVEEMRRFLTERRNDDSGRVQRFWKFLTQRFNTSGIRKTGVRVGIGV